MPRHVLLKELSRSVRGSLGRFLALFGIVALGCGFYAGLLMCGPTMRTSADAFYDGTHLDDLRVVSTLGFTDEQADLLKSTDGIDQVMGVRTCDVMATLNNEQYALRVSTFDVDSARASTTDATGAVVYSDNEAYLNRLVLAEGSWPSAPDECLISADRVMGQPLKVGDIVEVVYGTSSLDDVLAHRRFKVSGLVRASDYVSSVTLGYTSLGSGVIQQYLYVTDEAFDPDLPYTMLLATVRGADAELSGSEEYRAKVNEVKDRLEEQSDNLAASRLQQIKDDAQEQVDEAQDEYDTAKADADKELGDAKAELDKAQRDLDNASRDLDSASRDLDSVASTLASSRSQLNSALSQISAGQRELDSGYAQLEAGRAELNARQEEWDAGKQQLLVAQDGIAQIDAGLVQIDDGLAQIDDGIAQVQESDAVFAEMEASLQADLDAAGSEMPFEDRAELMKSIAMVRAARSEFASQLSQLTAQRDELVAQSDSLVSQRQEAVDAIYAAGFDPASLSEQIAATDAQLDAAWDELASNEARLWDAEAQLESARAQYNSGKIQLDEGQASYNSGKREYEEGKKEYEDGKKEYEEGKATYVRESKRAAEELADAASQIADAQRDVDELEPPEIYVFDRTTHLGPEAYLNDSHRMDHIASVFPLIFFLVAALVALTTMTRMVEDERQEIGCHKALGYSRASITAKYLAYGFIASAPGALFGIVVLTQVLPYVVMIAYAIMYVVPFMPFPLPVDPLIAAGSFCAGVGITLLATWASVAATLREVPATLMLPRAPKPGKRILLERIRPLWRRVSFSWKVTLRNIFRYKKRLLMTVVGILGCTALLLTGLGVHDSIWDIIAVQYEGDEPIFGYNVLIGIDDDASEDDLAGVEELLGELSPSCESTRLMSSNMQVGSVDGKDTRGISAVVPDDYDEFSHFVRMRDRLTHEPLEFGDDAVILTEKMAGKLGVSVGDEFVLYDQDDTGNAQGDGYRLRVTGIAENYVYHYCYIGKRAWKRAMGEQSEVSTLYARVENEDGELARALHDVDCVSTVMFATETIDGYRKSLRSVNMIVVVLILAAAALAFIVLYNLININIIERTREIASLKVLGFTRGEVAAYVFREIALLVMAGAGLGLGAGLVLVTFVIEAAEVDAVMFGRSVHPPSFVIAYVLTLVFSAAVMLFMVPKLKKISMVESLKSVD